MVSPHAVKAARIAWFSLQRPSGISSRRSHMPSPRQDIALLGPRTACAGYDVDIGYRLAASLRTLPRCGSGA
eukprot:2061202-Pyramimonas_sp.AAC.1